MAMIPQHTIDEIMQTSRIEEVIGEFVHLKKAGSSMKGLSPFTDEKTPSFVVSPAKQIFKCFSTGKGGTVVTFLMEKEHYSYPEALRWLADRYNIVLPEEKPATAEELAAITEKESLFIINDFAKNHFVQNMHEVEEGKNIGLSYFEERGFRPEIIKKFELGYCLNKGDDFTQTALAKNYKLDYLTSVGLVKSKEERNYDFFRGRVMFPIHSVSGRVLGFGGRTLQNDKKIAKYFNSPESPIYHKSDILYGLYFSKGDIIKYDNCYLCEGYTDVISMYQAGIHNVVSSSGTSLTREQIKLIRRFTQNITILYDGDSAGIKASFRGIDLILEEGLSVKVVLFPEGEDPDSFAKNNSESELKEYLKEHTQDFVSFKTEILLADSKNDPLKKAELIRDVVSSVALIPDTIVRTVYAKEIATKFDLTEDIVSNEIARARGNTQGSLRPTSNFKQAPKPIATPSSTPVAPAVAKEDDFNFHEFELIRVLIKYGVFAVPTNQINEDGKSEEVEVSITELICHELDKDELTFSFPLFNKIHEIFLEGIAQNTLYESTYFLRQSDQNIVKFVSGIESNEYELSPNWYTQHKIVISGEKEKLSALVMDSIYSFKKYKIEVRIQKLQKTLSEKGDEITDEESNDLLSELVLLERVKSKFAKELRRIII